MNSTAGSHRKWGDYGSQLPYLIGECSWLIVTTGKWTMRKTAKRPSDQIVKDIKRATRKHYSSEEKIRIVLDCLRGKVNETLSAIAPRTMVEC